MSYQEEVEPVMVIVDPWSSGYKLAREFLDRHIPVVAIWTVPEFMSNTGRYVKSFQHVSIEKTIAELREFDELIGVAPGTESGVGLADELAHEFGTRRNPIFKSEARKNKYIMGETLREAKLRAVDQMLATEWEQVEAFVQQLNPSPFKIVVKPNQSCCSDQVVLCHSMDEVKQSFLNILGHTNRIGLINDAVLIQEFLEGKEYIIDSISQDGHHSVCAIWESDKRSINGRFNVSFGTRPLAVDNSVMENIVDYSFQVLDALEIVNGPSHTELILTTDGPVLVEVGARCHGAEGLWQVVSNRAYGWNQITRTCEMYLDRNAFFDFPTYPRELCDFGMNLYLVSSINGVIQKFNELEQVKQMPSVFQVSLTSQVGDSVCPTVDMFTSPGTIQLIHSSQSQVEEDYERIHELTNKNFFQVAFDKSQLYKKAVPQPQDC